MKHSNPPHGPRSMSRRQFLKLAATTGLVAGCSSVQPPAAAPASLPPDTPTAQPPTATPTSAPSPTAQPSTATPTSAPVAIDRTDILKFYPDGPSKVVHTHHAGVWAGDRLSPEALRHMLDASITELTGLNDAREAWAALFKPTEKIAIKVNAFQNSIIWTHAPLVAAVVASLQDAGLPAEQIFIYDHLAVFQEAGYQVNKEGPGVRCLEEAGFSGKWKVATNMLALSDTLQSCDALINMPVLKSHMISGLTFAMKNHYGSVQFPSMLHYPIDQSIAELNALPPIKDRTRLVIGDILEANLQYRSGWPYWEADWKGDSILMSFDPVAHDALGMQILEQLQTENQAALSSMLRDTATAYLKIAAELGLGTHDPQNMEVVEVKLG